jgi:hypothetical protein
MARAARLLGLLLVVIAWIVAVYGPRTDGTQGAGIEQAARADLAKLAAKGRPAAERLAAALDGRRIPGLGITLRTYDPKYGYMPFLVRAGIIAFGVLFGVFNIVHGFLAAHVIEAPVNRFNWYLGSLILGLGLIVWPPVFFMFADATNGVAIFVAAGATIALGAGLAGRARRIERFLTDADGNYS